MKDKVLTDIRAQLIQLADQSEAMNEQMEKISLLLSAMSLKDKIQAATIDLKLERLSAEIEQLKKCGA